MALPITVPFTFGNATTTQSLSSLDADFSTVYNAVNGIGNGTVSLANVSITGGTISANITSSSISSGTSNVAITSSNGNVTAYTNGNLAMTIDSNLNTTFGGTAVMASSFLRNRIINGGMQIWQRGTSGFTTINNYSSDRWFVYAGTSLSAVAQSTDVPAGYKYSLSINGTNTPTAIQRIESVNCTDLAGQNVTISFWIKQTVGAGAGSISASLYYPTASDNYASATLIGTTTFTGTTGWVQYTYTFTSISSNAVNGLMLQVGAVGSGASTFLITGVQLEVGTLATPFERRLYGTELMLCQRYYQIIFMSAQSASIGYMITPFYGSVAMRSSPTMSQISGGTASNANIQGISPSSSQPSGYFQIQATAASGYIINASYYASAEL